MTAVHNWDLVGPADTDAELVQAAAAGDRDAFAGIYDRYADRLHDFCVGMLRDRDAAADCVQDAFCTAATRLSQLRDPEKLRPWLYAIARNEALRRIRERRRETPSAAIPDAESQEPGPDTLVARNELADLITEATGGLSDRDRSILELAYRHGLEGSCLADALGVSVGTAGKMVYRLRETVERSLGALLISRRARGTGEVCPELAAILAGWNGQFSVLMRKRIVRHIDSCLVCDEERRRLVNPVALLGGAPVLLPAPSWLREKTLDDIRLTPSSSPVVVDAHPAGSRERRVRRAELAAALVAVFVAALAFTIVGTKQKSVTIVPADVTATATASATTAAPAASSATASSPTPAPPPGTPSTSTVPVASPPPSEPPAASSPEGTAPPVRTPVEPGEPVSEPSPPRQRGAPERSSPPRVRSADPTRAVVTPPRRATNPAPKTPTRRVTRDAPDPPR